MRLKTLEKNRMKTVQQIMAAAIEVFSQSGFAGARMDAIADKAGVNKATIYYHIGDKQALYDRVIHTIFADVADAVEQIRGSDQSPDKRLSAYIRSITDAFKKHPHMSPIMMRELASGGRHLPDIAVSDLARIAEGVFGIIQEGTDRNLFIQTDPVLVHMMIVGTLAFFITAAPVRAEVAALTHALQTPVQTIQGEAGKEIEKLILRAIRAS
jgi:AcrR family transcriptional regulator